MYDYSSDNLSRWSYVGSLAYGRPGGVGVYVDDYIDDDLDYESKPDPVEVFDASFAEFLPFLTDDEANDEFFPAWEKAHSRGDKAQAESIAAKWRNIATQRKDAA